MLAQVTERPDDDTQPAPRGLQIGLAQAQSTVAPHPGGRGAQNGENGGQTGMQPGRPPVQSG